MMKETTAMNTAWKILVWMLALCLCAALLAGAAFAEPAAELGTGAVDDSLIYECTLPDGRLLLTGTKETDTVKKTRLVCLNPDLSVSWEYNEKEDGDCWNPYAALLEDGTIALAYRRFRSAGDDIVMKFFTQDGNPTGKEHTIPTEGESLWVSNATPASLTLERQLPEGDGSVSSQSEMEIWGWDGSLITRYFPEEINSVFFFSMYLKEEEGGVLMYGQDPSKRCAKIMKKDSLRGNALWESVLEHEYPETEDAFMFDVIGTEDGGYITLSLEYTNEPFTPKLILAKLDAEGRLQWMKKEDAGHGEKFHSMTVYDGKIVLNTTSEENRDTVKSFRWFDIQGNELGATELVMKPEDFPGLNREENGTEELIVSGLQMVPAENGLWGILYGRMQSGTAEEATEETVQDMIMVRIPVL